MRLGVPELYLLGMMLAPIVGIVFLIVMAARLPARARRLGYASTRAYLRAAPSSDAEKRDAADLALKGLVFCLLALIFPPLVFVGIIPLFYGARKLTYGLMGLGLVDDGEPPAR
jgi:hypothetical protein